MGLLKQIKASRRAMALRLDGYMLWEEPFACPHCKNTEWKVLGGLADFASVTDALFARRPEAAAAARDGNPRSLCTCGGCGRAYRVFEDREHNQLFFNPRPWPRA
jgi:hypothetical protein